MKKEKIVLLALALILIPTAVATAPTILLEQSDFFACETSQFSLQFQTIDNIEQSLNIDLTPIKPFFVRALGNSTAELFSSNLTKEQAGKIHELTLSASNPDAIETKKVGVKVIEINNPPKLETMKVQTISLDETNSFSKQISARDIESQTLTFKSNFLSGEKLFDISPSGLIETALSEANAGIYEIEICAQDSGLRNLDEQTEFCGENGEKKFACDKFQLTLALRNNQPTITGNAPKKTELNTTEGEEIIFSIETFDPENSLPDIYWYVDSELKEFHSGLNADKLFSTLFECDSAGLHSVKAEITDGLLNDSLIWSVRVGEDETCEPKISQTQCGEKWACDSWSECQDALQSNQFGTLSGEDFDKISTDCRNLGIADELCGFQLRLCEDINSCETEDNKPSQVQACRFIENPSCSDGIKNCHDGFCELAVDCAGDCASCLTCSDGIKNQNEEGIDCGGPCSAVCPAKNTIIRQKAMKYGTYALLAILFVIALIKLIHIIIMERKLSHFSNHDKVFNNERM